MVSRRFSSFSRLVSWLAAAALCVACGGPVPLPYPTAPSQPSPTPQPDGPAPAYLLRVTVTPSAARVKAGEIVELKASTETNGPALAGRTIKISDTLGVATIEIVYPINGDTNIRTYYGHFNAKDGTFGGQTLIQGVGRTQSTVAFLTTTASHAPIVPWRGSWRLSRAHPFAESRWQVKTYKSIASS